MTTPAADGGVAVHIVLLGGRDDDRNPDGCIDAVLAWTDHGKRHYQRIDQRRPSPRTVATRFTLQVTSSGLTWRTWTLDSVPVELRHLPPAGAVRALAARLAC